MRKRVCLCVLKRDMKALVSQCFFLWRDMKRACVHVRDCTQRGARARVSECGVVRDAKGRVSLCVIVHCDMEECVFLCTLPP